MKLLVVGATGPTGLQLVRQALARGYNVAALVRAPSAELEAIDGAEQVRGDVLDPGSLEQAVAGRDAVLSALGSKMSLRPVTLLSEGTKNIVAAMRTAGAKRLIAITGIGAGDSRGHGGFVYDHLVEPVLLGEVYKDKDRQEAVIRESGLDWTIVRPAQLTDESPKNRYRVLTELDGIKAGNISRADVAGFVLDELRDRRFIGKTPLITD